MNKIFNKLKQNWIKATIGVVAVIFIYFGFVAFQGDTYKCPDDYVSSEERLADFDKWTKEFYDKNPDASYSDLSDARRQFYINHNCQEALQRVEDWETGNVDPETKEMINRVAEETLGGYRTFASDEYGFSFKYPDYLVAEIYPEQPSWVVVFPVSKIENDNEPMTAIIISIASDNMDMTAEEWLLGPNAGYKESEDGSYRRIKIDGQDAVITDYDWVVVKTPDNKYRLSIAYLVEEENGAEPLREELVEILKNFSFDHTE